MDTIRVAVARHGEHDEVVAEIARDMFHVPQQALRRQVIEQERNDGIDVLKCQRCEGRLEIVATLTEAEPIRRILEHFGESATGRRPSGVWQPYLAFLDNCLPSGCQTFDDLRFVDNRGDAPRDVVLRIMPRSGGDGVFDLVLHLQTLATNDQCSTPMPVADGAHLTNQNPALGTPLASTSGCGATGPQLYYSITLDPGYTVRATIRPTDPSGWDVSVSSFDDCAASTCYWNDRVPPYSTGTFTHLNAASTPSTSIIALGGRQTMGINTFDLDIAVLPP